MRFKNRVVLVTGSGSGIGRAVATLFAKEGAKVVVVDVVPKGGQETVKMIKDAGGEAAFLQCDVTKNADVEAMVNKAVEVYGTIDILHNNAGGWDLNQHDTVHGNSEEQWDHWLNLNLKSVYLVSHFVLPHMIKKKNGVIINTITTNATMTYPNFAAYSAAKAGSMELIKAMALDYGRYGIRVNGVSPGETRTPQWYHTWDVPGAEEGQRMLLKKIPLGRWAKPEDIANGVAFLASDEASYITGITLFVDGGLTAGFTE